MGKIKLKIFCDKNICARTETWYEVSERGKAAFIGVACPIEDSISGQACEKVLSVASNSFMRRPSVEDIAMINIDGFLNQSVFPLQEPRQASLCSTAFIFVMKGKARYSLTGMTGVFHFLDGELIETIKPINDKLYGCSMRWDSDLQEPIDLSSGLHEFLICSNKKELSITEEEAKKIYKANKPNQSEELQVDSAMEVEGAILFVSLPERKKGFLFSKGRKSLG